MVFFFKNFELLFFLFSIIFWVNMLVIWFTLFPCTWVGKCWYVVWCIIILRGVWFWVKGWFCLQSYFTSLRMTAFFGILIWRLWKLLFLLCFWNLLVIFNEIFLFVNVMIKKLIIFFCFKDRKMLILCFVIEKIISLCFK